MKKIILAAAAAMFIIFSMTMVFAEDSLPYTDVSKDKWYYDNVKYVSEKNLMTGVSSSKFKPDVTVSRAQIVTALYRLEGEPAVQADSIFSDVDKDMWYYSAVAWAAENGIVNGYKNNTFRPDQAVIREQVAAILYRYMKYAGDSFRGDFNYQMNFYDTTEASDYAMDSIYWVTFKGLLQGDNKGNFNPKAVTTRAQLAAVLARYVKQKEAAVIDENQQRAEEIVASMSLKEKIGQMIMVAMRQYGSDSSKTNVTQLNSNLKKAIKDYDFGGIILFAQNTTSVEQTTRLIANMQAASETPLLIGIDQEGGRVVRAQYSTCFGGNMALAATGDTTKAYKAASIIGEEMSSMGINVDFAPCMDINTNPNNPVIGTRSFSDNPEDAADYGTAFISGLHDGGLATAIKHFPGHGDTSTDSHTGLPLVEKYYDELAWNELIPFYSGIKAGTDIVMTAHIQFPNIEKDTYTSILDGSTVGIPATLSDDIITGILRNKMGYDGVVITDAMDMNAITTHFDSRDAAKMAINAGVDILLMPVTLDSATGIAKMGDYIDAIVEMVENGEIPMSEIDDSAVRVIKLKLDRGIWDEAAINVNEKIKHAKAVVGCDEHRDFEWTLALESVTLVKNDGVLPLKADEIESLGVFFPYDGEENLISTSIERLKAESIIDDSFKINDYVYGRLSDEEVAASVSENDVVVVISEMGSPSYLDPTTANGKYGAKVKQLIEAAHLSGKKVVLISANLPYDASYFTEADAILCTYCCKSTTCSVGGGFYSIFRSPDEITGRLPVKI